MRRLCRLLGWFVVVDALITMFGVTTAPLLLTLAADGVVLWLIILSFIEIRATLLPASAETPVRVVRRWPLQQAPAPRCFPNPTADPPNDKEDY